MNIEKETLQHAVEVVFQRTARKDCTLQTLLTTFFWRVCYTVPKLSEEMYIRIMF